MPPGLACAAVNIALPLAGCCRLKGAFVLPFSVSYNQRALMPCKKGAFMSLNKKYIGLGNQPNAIRELFAYGQARKAEIGDDKVFDFSIGNPSVPAPQKVADTIAKLLEEPAAALHGYSQSPGQMGVRQAIAASIKRRFGVDAQAKHVYMTHGAAAGLAIAINAVALPGEEVIAVAPYFCEYQVWTEHAGATLVEVPAHEGDFQIDVPAMEAAINEKTAAIIIDSPNNPVGVVYTRENLQEFAAMLERKEQEVGHPIYLISDEPYREITYGIEVPYVPCLYKDTIVCYSYSKSLSLPGERIGYIYVSDMMENADDVFYAICGSARDQGYICASVLFQRVVEECVDEPSDVEAYRSNRELLCSIMDELGYEYVPPDGAFYLWVKALEEDDLAFCAKAKEHELLLVPSSCFKSKGYARVSYCVSAETIRNSKQAFADLKAEYSA